MPKVKRVRNPRGQGDHLREEILIACTTLLDQSGSELTISLRSIAHEAGIAAPSISRHFHDIHEIIDAVVARELDGFQRGFREVHAATQNPHDRIIELVKAYVSFGIHSPSRYRVLFSRIYSPYWSDTGRSMVETSPLMTDTFALVRDSVQECIDAGVAAKVDANTSTVMLWYSLHGLITLRQSITSFPWPDIDVAVAQILQDSIGLHL